MGEQENKNITNNDLFSLLKTIQNQINDVKQDINKINTKFDEQRIVIQELTEKVNYLETENQELKRKLNTCENEARSNNLVIFGLQEQTDHSLIEIASDFTLTHLEVTITCQDINNIYRIGKNPQNGKPRPLMLQLISNIKKQEIFKNVKKLKNSGITIANDLSETQRNKQKVLYQHLKEAKSKQYSAKIYKNTLIVNGESFTYEELIKKDSTTPIEQQVPADLPKKTLNSAPSSPSIQGSSNSLEYIDNDGQEQEKINIGDTKEEEGKRKRLKNSPRFTKKTRSATK